MTLLQANPVSPADYGPFRNGWANPNKPGGGTYARGRHGGLDFQSTYLAACVSGVIRRRNYGPDYGIQIQIDAGGYEFTYSHARRLYVSDGQQVHAGQRIGEVGATGNVTGPHLHFEIHTDPGVWRSDIDPEPFIRELEGGDDMTEAECRAVVRDEMQRAMQFLLLSRTNEAFNPAQAGNEWMTQAQQNTLDKITHK